jgi:hypothetical protein
MSAPARSADAPLSLPALVGNFLLYQVAWFACVLGAAAGLPLIGTAVSGVVVGLRLASAARPAAELQLILLAGLIGGAWESLLVGMDWVHYRGGELPGLAPSWIVALWLAFATTFNVSLRWLQGRPGAAALLGLAGGPLAWWAGARLGALELVDAGLALSAIGLGWAVLMPLLLALAAWLNGPKIQTEGFGG